MPPVLRESGGTMSGHAWANLRLTLSTAALFWAVSELAEGLRFRYAIALALIVSTVWTIALAAGRGWLKG